MAALYNEEGWYYGYSPTDELDFDAQGEHRYVKRDIRNVIGRFRTHYKVDVPASKKARKEVQQPIIVLETRNLKTANGPGTDISALEIRFDDDFWQKSVTAIKRFPEAWQAYQVDRKIPVSDPEALALSEAGVAAALAEPAPKPKPQRAPRKPRAKKATAENVVPLKAASA